MLLLKLDLHVHSHHSHDCKCEMGDIIDTALKKGLSGIAVTDHNTFEGAKELMAADKKGLIAIPGAEYTTEKGHVLALFINRGIDELGVTAGARGIYNCDAALAAIHSLGGIAILAHPFKKGSAKHDHDSIFGFDGIEVYNARAALSRPDANILAGRLAQDYSLMYTAGSDAHHTKEIGNAFIALEIKEPGLSAIKREIMMSWGDIYGTNSNRVSEAHSQILRGKKLKLSAGVRMRMLLRFLRAVLVDFLRFARVRPKGFEGMLMRGGKCVAAPYNVKKWE